MSVQLTSVQDLSDLNPSQREAVLHDEGPMLVLAGAGSGKTRVVTRRIARLIRSGVAPSSLLAVTFTNKAAAEMRERVAYLVGPRAAREIRVMTFHSFGLELLSTEAAALGLRSGGFTVYDQADCISTIREILRFIDAGKRFDVSAILARISLAKNAFETQESWRSRPHDEYDEIAREIFPRYQTALRAFHAFDFDDLVTEAVELLRRRDDVRQRWQRKIRYLMVDEYQDTNAAQLELVRLLSGEWGNVAVVGDDDQSIYAWRGADITNILRFTEHFPGARVVKLEENYRSSASILAVANAVLAGSRGKRFGKVLKATRDQGPRVEVAVCLDPEIEAHFVVDQIQRATAADPSLTHDEIAVLYRSNGQAEPVELALKEAGIPHRILGGQKFYERKEVKDLLAYLRVALAPDDEISVRRVLNYPARGVGEASLQHLSNYALSRDLTLWQAIERADDIDALSAAAVEGCRQFEQVVTRARQLLERGTPCHQVAEEVARRIGLKEDLMAASPGEAFARRWRNVESLIHLLKRRDERGPSDLQRVSDYLRMLTLQLSEDDEDTRRVVTLCTMHGAKGLEWRFVLIIGVEEGFLPHTRTTDPRATAATDQDIEEERRLFYVAITRAREKLWISRCKYRSSRGKPVARTPSRFLQELPPELYDQREVLLRPGPDFKRMAEGVASVLKALDALKAGTVPPPRRRP
ncbi:MAG: UvrD-helicase domain-containing protein [Myxococcales bacterium]|nr:exodeoxyribonuclease V subunit gamma [Polyangiaceae bacterium]MDW8248144.1 UvrD-helicase domain-containing protein [Myxococcales bacterium]